MLGHIFIPNQSGAAAFQPGISHAEGEGLLPTPLPPPYLPWEARPSTCFLDRWLPESACWLMVMGKPDQALQELKKVARINGHREAEKTLTVEVRCYCLRPRVW